MFDPQMEEFIFEKKDKEKCKHPHLEFSTDLSCGGWFETCTVCREIINCGMMGHN